MMMMMMVMIAGLVDSIATPIKSWWLDDTATTRIADMMIMTAVKEVDHSSGGGSCIVCLSEVALGDRFALLERCRHGFHADCVEAWLKDHPNCPLCRTPVSDAQNYKQLHLKKWYEVVSRYGVHLMETIATWLTTSFTQGLHSSISHSCIYL